MKKHITKKQIEELSMTDRKEAEWFLGEGYQLKEITSEYLKSVMDATLIRNESWWEAYFDGDVFYAKEPVDALWEAFKFAIRNKCL